MPKVRPIPIPAFFPQLLDFTARHLHHTELTPLQLAEIQMVVKGSHRPTSSLRHAYDEDRYELGEVTLFVTPDSIMIMQKGLIVGGSFKDKHLYIRIPHNDPYMTLTLTKTVVSEPIQ